MSMSGLVARNLLLNKLPPKDYWTVQKPLEGAFSQARKRLELTRRVLRRACHEFVLGLVNTKYL